MLTCAGTNVATDGSLPWRSSLVPFITMRGASSGNDRSPLTAHSSASHLPLGHPYAGKRERPSIIAKGKSNCRLRKGMSPGRCNGSASEPSTRVRTPGRLHSSAQGHGPLRRRYVDSGHRPSCLIPGFDGALFSLEWKDALWARFCTGAPPRQRRCVERYSIRSDQEVFGAQRRLSRRSAFARTTIFRMIAVIAIFVCFR